MTAVGMFGGGGFALSPPTRMSLPVVVGGLGRRRFVADLRRRMEDPTAVADAIGVRD